MNRKRAASLVLTHRSCRSVSHTLLIAGIAVLPPALLGGCEMTMGAMAAAANTEPDRPGLRLEDAGYRAESAWDDCPHRRLTYE